MEVEIRDVKIQRYFPDVDINAKEFQALAEAENPEFNLIWEIFRRDMLNTFVMDIDESGAARWEKMLKIRPKTGASLESRRAVILAKINMIPPITHRRLEQILDAVYGAGTYEIWIEYAKCLFRLRTDISAGTERTEQYKNTLIPLLPLNLDIGYEIQAYFKDEESENFKDRLFASLHPALRDVYPWGGHYYGDGWKYGSLFNYGDGGK